MQHVVSGCQEETRGHGISIQIPLVGLMNEMSTIFLDFLVFLDHLHPLLH